MRADSNTRKIPLTQGYVALVDAEDYEFLAHWKWQYSSGYAVRSYRSDGRYVRTYMHRTIMLPDPGEDIDHVNHNPLDNRRMNLRACSHRDNRRNQIRSRNNTSGYKGVSWRGRDKAWRAYISPDGKAQSLGYYANPEEAARAYDRAALDLFGEFACLNFEEV